MGTASVQGELWGAKAEDWAEVQEPAWRPVFETALELAGVRPGLAALDVGCGAGGALAIAEQRGAMVSGLDGSANLVAIARRRLPGARIEIGDMEELPFSDESVDIVLGLNSYQFAGNLGRALGEARRVLKRGGTFFMLRWGRPEDCQLTATMRPVLALLPGANAPPAPSGNAEDVIREAGLRVLARGAFPAELAFADASTAVRAVMSAGITVRAVRVAGEAAVREVIARTLPPMTRANGAVVWANTFQWVKALRPADD